MALIEMRQRIGKLLRRNHSQVDCAPKVFSEALLSKDQYRGLPFDISVTNGGFTIRRNGDYNEEGGDRIFIIDNDSLNRFDKLIGGIEKLKAEDYYKLLKTYERRNGEPGRHLALDQNSEINLDRDKFGCGYTIIVKEVDHPTKNRFRIPDKARLKFTPAKGFEEVITERIIPLYKGKPVDLTLATRDAGLRIREPWFTNLTKQEQEDWEHFVRVGGASKHELMDIKARNENEKSITIPSKNTLVIKELREKQGSVSAPPLEADIFRNENGQLVVRIDRNSGVNGIKINGELYILGQEDEQIEVPLIQPDQDNSTLELWFYAGTTHSLRLGVALGIRRKEGRILADFISGVAEPHMPNFNASEGILSSQSSSSILLLEQQRETERLNEERQRKEEMARDIKSSCGLIVSEGETVRRSDESSVGGSISISNESLGQLASLVSADFFQKYRHKKAG